MKNQRELRMSLFYFILFVMMIFSIWLIRVTGFVHKGSGNMFNLALGILMAFLFIAPIVCLAAAIYHLVKAVRFAGKIEGRKVLLKWTYDKQLWRKFIRGTFMRNCMDDCKSIAKLSIILIPITLAAMTLMIAFSQKPPAVKLHLYYLMLPFGICTVYFLWVMGKNAVKLLDHLLFSDYTIEIMAGGVIFNGEYINWGALGECELVRKKIRDGAIEIIYVTRARSAGRGAGIYTAKDIRRLRIPIPKGRHKEAEAYMNVLFPVHRL
jgi:hypothetical protein